MNTGEIIKKIFLKALSSVNPELIVTGYSEKIMSYFSMKNFRKVLVIGFGKASYQMACAIEDSIGDKVALSGAVVTKYGHAVNKASASGDKQSAIKVYEAAHPVPDENGIKATEMILNELRSADETALIMCLVSGGGSALFVSPCEGITLNQKQEITNLLLKAGADISELNAVRKHLSKVKGGRLAEIAYPAEIISLMISDVIGDRLDVIASGPTAPDSSTFRDALDVIDKYNLRDRAPSAVVSLLEEGVSGSAKDTPKKDSPVFQKVQNIIVGSNGIAIEAAQTGARQAGLDTSILSSRIDGDAGEAAKWLAEKAFEVQSSHLTRKNRSGRPDDIGLPACLISGGETTVVVKGKGKGGRNTELALVFAMEIEGSEGITMLSAGTDGTDGPTDAAGAVVDGQTMEKARSLGLDPQQYLENNDSYTFFDRLDCLLKTGPTGTNVMDLQIIIIE